MSEWVSVKDHLPPKHEFVLVISVMENANATPYSLAKHDGCGRWSMIGEEEAVWEYYFWRIASPEEEITHWMKLPEPPNEMD